MTTTQRTAGVVIGLLLVQSLVTIPVASAQLAVTDGGTSRPMVNQSSEGSQLETADGYLAAFQDLNGSSALANYTEFEVLRSQAISEVQVGDFDDVEETRMNHVLRILRSFEAAFLAERNESYRSSLVHANESIAAIEALRGTSRQSYVVLSELALERFHADLGVRLSDSAQSVEHTPQRLQLLEYAATAYRRAGAVDRYSETRVRIDNQRREFREDLNRYNRSVAAAQKFVERCDGQCRSPVDSLRSERIGVFEQYTAAVDARSASISAIELASEHGLSDRVTEARTLRDRTTQAAINLAVASAAILVGYALVIIVLVAILVPRIVAWERDVEQARVDEIVLTGGVGS